MLLENLSATPRVAVPALLADQAALGSRGDACFEAEERAKGLPLERREPAALLQPHAAAEALEAAQLQLSPVLQSSTLLRKLRQTTCDTAGRETSTRELPSIRPSRAAASDSGKEADAAAVSAEFFKQQKARMSAITLYVLLQVLLLLQGLQLVGRGSNNSLWHCSSSRSTRKRVSTA
ncbi:hypothetical protein cyc_03499 [Cyclospora cayetanensis]|uniref:Uncharacterized protein n=1 Tax=Cyclospora cayetanensis TaxID=88456 RepID=A0A1D3CRT9_9EIME|nr:hypothetical protein cyc_03499 [Cyclospora cayetanensis]